MGRDRRFFPSDEMLDHYGGRAGDWGDMYDIVVGLPTSWNHYHLEAMTRQLGLFDDFRDEASPLRLPSLSDQAGDILLDFSGVDFSAPVIIDGVEYQWILPRGERTRRHPMQCWHHSTAEGVTDLRVSGPSGRDLDLVEGWVTDPLDWPNTGTVDYEFRIEFEGAPVVSYTFSFDVAVRGFQESSSGSAVAATDGRNQRCSFWAKPDLDFDIEPDPYMVGSYSQFASPDWAALWTRDGGSPDYEYTRPAGDRWLYSRYNHHVEHQGVDIGGVSGTFFGTGTSANPDPGDYTLRFEWYTASGAHAGTMRGGRVILRTYRGGYFGGWSSVAADDYEAEPFWETVTIEDGMVSGDVTLAKVTDNDPDNPASITVTCVSTPPTPSVGAEVQVQRTTKRGFDEWGVPVFFELVPVELPVGADLVSGSYRHVTHPTFSQPVILPRNQWLARCGTLVRRRIRVDTGLLRDSQVLGVGCVFYWNTKILAISAIHRRGGYFSSDSLFFGEPDVEDEAEFGNPVAWESGFHWDNLWTEANNQRMAYGGRFLLRLFEK